MSFWVSIRNCFRKYARFSGRANRPEFWWFALFVLLAMTGLWFVDALLWRADWLDEEGPSYLGDLFYYATLLPLVAVSVRRLHDTGRSAWSVLVVIALIAVSFALEKLSGVRFDNVMEGTVSANGPAASLAATAMLVVGIGQIGLSIVIVWWLTRPSQPGPNRYGPRPLPQSA